MIINLKQSKLFTIDPDKRFAREYGLPEGLWNLIYRRHKILEYSIDELCELYQIKTGKKTTHLVISRWVWRSDVYNKASKALESGACTVVSSYFGDLEWSIIKELTKNLQSSVKKDTKALP